jgi:hypothetical protein
MIAITSIMKTSLVFGAAHSSSGIAVQTPADGGIGTGMCTSRRRRDER